MGNVEPVFDPMAWMAYSMLGSAMLGFIVARPIFGWPQPAWLRSPNLLKRAVVMLAYTLMSFLPVICLCLIIWSGLHQIGAVEAYLAAQTWQIRLGMFSVLLAVAWLLASIWFIRAASKPLADGEVAAVTDTGPFPTRALSERDRQVAERRKAEAVGLVEALIQRRFGLFMLTIGALCAHRYVYVPYVAMHDGFTSVELVLPVVVGVPYLLVIGLAYGVIGSSAHELLGSANRPNWARRAFDVFALVAGVVLYWWLDQQMPGV